MALEILLVFPESGGSSPIGESELTDPSLASSLPNASVIEVTSFDLAAENAASIGSANGGAGAGKAQFEPLVITRNVGKASPALFSLVASGQVLDTVQMYVRQAGAGPVTLVAYEFRTVAITKIEWSGNTGADVPTETVTLEYGAMVIAFQPTNPDGSPGQVAQSGWNRITNTQDTSSSLALT
jgi:type VI secretion system secreted protein Hcp